MKRMLLMWLTVMFFGSLCLAQQASTPVSQTAPALIETQTLTGRVFYVLLGNAVKKVNKKTGKEKEGEKRRRPDVITVMRGEEETTDFRVRPETSITAKNGRALKLSRIEVGDTITVVYTTDTKKDTHEAVSIKVVRCGNRLWNRVSRISSLVTFGGKK